MDKVEIKEGSRVRITKICEDDAFFGQECGEMFIGEQGVMISHYPNDDQECGSSGTRGGCVIKLDREIDIILGLSKQLPDDRILVMADVEIEEVVND
jgi:hypothetical protein